jgi:membrane-bound lytic murein transglycosylase B
MACANRKIGETPFFGQELARNRRFRTETNYEVINMTCRIAAAVLALFTLPALADFEQCKSRLSTLAIEQGITQATVEQVFADVEQIPRVIASDRSQPEFTQTFTEYYQRRVTSHRVEEGRKQLAVQAPLLREIQQATGVPPHYLVALWGLETNFGSYFGKLSIPSALTTLACDTRRAAFFQRELLAVLQIVDRGDIEASALIGSWAGAIGHMQFMPTTFLQHAIDGDGDGRRDLIGNLPDALGSGGSYLQSLGWHSGYRWGREVLLSDDFDYTQAGLDQWRPLSSWRALGVTDVSANPMPDIELEAALLVPTGHQGPAFLVYPNFRVIMGWNRSEAYALSVGRLADRIAGAGRLHNSLPAIEDLRVPTEDVIRLQQQLNTLGFDSGEPDGVLGPATRKAISGFQKANSLIADGYPDSNTRALIFER